LKGNGHGSYSFDEPPQGFSNGHDKPNGKTQWQNNPAWEHEKEPFEALDFASLPDKPDTPRRWVVPGWIPMLETCGLGGSTSAGKTLLAQQLATCIAFGRDCLGKETIEHKVAMVLCEDYLNDAHWRQVGINKHYGLHMADLAGRLLIMPRRRKKFNYLGIFDRDGELHHTTFFHQLIGELYNFSAKFVVLDTRADVFRGNQNDEHHAREFVRKTTDLIAQELDGAVMMLYQPSRAGRRDGSGESGSVQWDSAFRSRLSLTPRSDSAEDQEQAIGARLLKFYKSTWSEAGEVLDINWNDHVFVREQELAAENTTAIFERRAEQSKEDRVFLKMLDLYTVQGRLVTSSRHGNYAPRIFSEDNQAEGLRLSSFERAMTRLFAQNAIKQVTVNQRDKIVKVEKP
jgi:RecA-family ATPase